MNKLIKVTLAYSILLSFLEESEKNIEEIIFDLKRSFKESIIDIEILFSLQGKRKDFSIIKKKFEQTNSQTNLKFIYSGLKGVCKSRNFAIKNSDGYFIHFLDADCRFNFDNFERNDYLKILSIKKDSIIFLKSPLINFNKSFSISSFANHINLGIEIHIFDFLKNALSSPSYTIIIPKFFFYKYKISFDQNLGLGSKLNQSEEICLLLSILKKNLNQKFNILNLKNFYAESKSHITNRSKTLDQIISKGYVVRKIMPIMGIFILPLVSVIFYFKLKRKISFLDSFISVYKGFFKIY